jgi:hypothetical protein
MQAPHAKHATVATWRYHPTCLAGCAPLLAGINGGGGGSTPPPRIKNRGRPLPEIQLEGSTPVFYSSRGVDPPPP